MVGLSSCVVWPVGGIVTGPGSGNWAWSIQVDDSDRNNGNSRGYGGRDTRTTELQLHKNILGGSC